MSQSLPVGPQSTPFMLREYRTAPVSRTNIALGLLISLILHLLFIEWTWHHRSGRLHADAALPITVHLLPFVPPPEAETAATPPPKYVPQPGKPVKAAAPLPRAAIVQVPPKTRETAPSATTTAPATPPPEKHLDMNAIYGGVKTAVAEVDREQAETPVGQLAAKPLTAPEDGNKMRKMIDGTTRADCKEQVSNFGLLAPAAALATLLDKKDSGCKWR